MYRDMWERIQRFIDRIESRWALWGLVSGSAAVSGLSGWLASRAEWLSSYGEIAWLIAALLGGLLFAAIFAVIAWGRDRFIHASATARWVKQRPADAVNPLDTHFHKQRISWRDLAHPVRPIIRGKKFSDCQLIGPVQLAFMDNNTFYRVGFLNCNFVMVKEGAAVFDVVMLDRVEVTGGEIVNATIFVTPGNVSMFKGIRQVMFVNQTGDPEIDSRSPEGIAPGIQP